MHRSQPENAPVLKNVPLYRVWPATIISILRNKLSKHNKQCDRIWGVSNNEGWGIGDRMRDEGLYTINAYQFNTQSKISTLPPLSKNLNSGSKWRIVITFQIFFNSSYISNTYYHYSNKAWRIQYEQPHLVFLLVLI